MATNHSENATAQKQKSHIVSECPTDQGPTPIVSTPEVDKPSNNGNLSVLVARTSPPDPAQTGHPATNLTVARTSRDIPGLSERQMRALDLLAEGTPDSQVAITINVDRRTIYRWRQHRIFRIELERLITDLRSVARDRVNLLLPAAFETIHHHLSNPAHKNSLTAAQFIIRMALGNSLELSPQEKYEKESEERLTHLASNLIKRRVAKDLVRLKNPTR